MTKKQNDLENAKDSWIKKYGILLCGILLHVTGLALVILCFLGVILKIPSSFTRFLMFTGILLIVFHHWHIVRNPDKLSIASFGDFIREKEERIRSCIFFASAGISLALLVYFFFTQWPINITNSNSVYKKIAGSLVIIGAGLPISFYFWYLRNHDKLEQIEISQEQIKISREDNLFSDFSNATKLFLEKENIAANSIGLRLLMQIKNERNAFENKIDLITPYKNLQGAKLQEADLQNAKLQESVLQGANLQGADLRNANLQKANLQNGSNLQNANLQGTNLQNAYLQRANLKNAILHKADLQDADLYLAELQGTDLQDANLKNVILFITKENLLKIKETDQSQTCSRQELESLLKKKHILRGSLQHTAQVRAIQKGERYAFEVIKQH